MINVKFKEWDCVLQFAKYRDNDRTALCLIVAEINELIATCTINIPGEPLGDDQVIIKDYSENEGMLKALTDANVVGPPIRFVYSGYITAPVCTLLVTEDKS